MLHYALYCLLTACDILAMQELVWSRVFCFGASYANLKQYLRSEFMEETLSCIWVHMIYMICIILNYNGFAYQTVGETNFHNVLLSFRNESVTQETTVCRVNVTYHVWACWRGSVVWSLYCCAVFESVETDITTSCL